MVSGAPGHGPGKYDGDQSLPRIAAVLILPAKSCGSRREETPLRELTSWESATFGGCWTSRWTWSCSALNSTSVASRSEHTSASGAVAGRRQRGRVHRQPHAGMGRSGGVGSSHWRPGLGRQGRGHRAGRAGRAICRVRLAGPGPGTWPAGPRRGPRAGLRPEHHDGGDLGRGGRRGGADRHEMGAGPAPASARLWKSLGTVDP